MPGFCKVRFFFLMIRRPPRSTQSRSSAASDVYKRQTVAVNPAFALNVPPREKILSYVRAPVSYTHLRPHETRHDLVCRLLLEKKKTNTTTTPPTITTVGSTHRQTNIQQSH